MQICRTLVRLSSRLEPTRSFALRTMQGRRKSCGRHELAGSRCTALAVQCTHGSLSLSLPLSHSHLSLLPSHLIVAGAGASYNCIRSARPGNLLRTHETERACSAATDHGLLASADQSRPPALRYRIPSFPRARRSKPPSPAAAPSRLGAAPDGVIQQGNKPTCLFAVSSSFVFAPSRARRPRVLGVSTHKPTTNPAVDTKLVESLMVQQHPTHALLSAPSLSSSAPACVPHAQGALTFFGKAWYVQRAFAPLSVCPPQVGLLVWACAVCAPGAGRGTHRQQRAIHRH